MQPDSTDKETKISLEYYTRPFLYLHLQLLDLVKQETTVIRKDFFQLIPEGDYTYLRGKGLFEAYQQSLEGKISKIVGNYSAAYWLHLSRRIYPYSPGSDKQPMTISIIRSILTIAIQKYGRKQFCSHVGASGDIDISSIFNGLLLSDEFELERILLKQLPSQLVLTDFSHTNLIEYYYLEKLCYEYWFCQAKIRALQKGAIIKVELSNPEIVQEFRSQELDWLIRNYDNRDSDLDSSLTGTVFTDSINDTRFKFFFPLLNIQEIPAKQLNPIFKQLFDISFSDEYVINYLPMPFDIKNYLFAHLPFETDFIARNGIGFQVVLFVIAALGYSYFHEAVVLKDRQRMLQIILRGYEGFLSENQIVELVIFYQKETKISLGLPFVFSKGEVRRAVNYLKALDSEKITLTNFVNLKLLIPVHSNKFYVDYSVIPALLSNMFAGINLNRHNFRGKTLESAFHGHLSFLPTKPIKNLAGKTKQVDFSVKINNILILGECKVVAMSSGYYGGDLAALNHRFEKVIAAGLTQADDKADFLCRNSVGRNYNLLDIDYILPIAISPFKEFLPSKSPYYWITETVPRVLTIAEVNELISNGIEIKKTFNLKRVLKI